MKSFIIICGIIAVIASSCNSGEKEMQCSRIDSLLTVSTNFQDRLDSISVDSIARYYSTILNFNRILKKELHGLPKDFEIKDHLLKMGSVEKGFKKIPDKINYFKNEIKFSLEQLNALKKDIEAELLKDNEFETYFDDELKAIKNITPEIENILKILNKNLNNYKTLLPDVKTYVDSLANS